MTRKNTDDRWESEWKSGFKEPGDYLAGEPPNVDTVGYLPDEAPYPREWTADQRCDMTWYAQRHNVKVPYDPVAADEGASGWYAARDAMLRYQRDRNARVEVARVAGVNPQPVLAEPEPAYVPDPSEPRHQRDEIEDW